MVKFYSDGEVGVWNAWSCITGFGLGWAFVSHILFDTSTCGSPPFNWMFWIGMLIAIGGFIGMVKLYYK